MNSKSDSPSAARPSPALGFLLRLLRTAEFRGRIRALRTASIWLGGATVSAPAGPLRLRLDPRDYEQARMALGNYEPETARLVSNILHRGDLYIDAGAQLGYFAALAAREIGPAGAMLLLEPDPRPYQALRTAIAAVPPNKFPQTRLVPVAASDRAGPATLNLSQTIGRSSLERATTTDPLDACNVVLQTLDALIEEWPPAQDRSIRLLKIDVEGHEPWLLRGLARTLGRKAIEFVIVEKNPVYLEAQGHRFPAIDAYLRSFGFVPFHEDGRPATRPDASDGKLENMLYALKPEEAPEPVRTERERFADNAASDQPNPEEIERLAAEIADPLHPELLARRIVLKARSGALAEAIEEAAALIAAHPELEDLRGHLGYWRSLKSGKT